MASSSNKLNFLAHTLLAVAITSSLTACDKPDVKANMAMGDQASFQIDSASGYGETVQDDQKAAWKIPNSVLFSFQACMTDRATGEKLRGHKFEVENPETGTRIPVDEPSDIRGCIKWSEPVPFNYYAKKSSRLPFDRLIVGTGLHTGKREVKLAINPWAVGSDARDRGDAVIFLRDQILPKSQLAQKNQVQAMLSGDQDGRAELWISEIGVKTIRTSDFGDGSVIDVTFGVQPSVEMTDMNGKVSYQKIPTGSFDIIAHLIATNTGPLQNEKVILNTQDITGSGRVRDGELLINARTSLERRVVSGNLQLAIKLVPRNIGSLVGLRPYEGIFDLGDYKSFSHSPKGSITAVCNNDNAKSQCTVEQALAGATNFEQMARGKDATPDKEGKEKWAFKNDPMIFSNLKLRFATIQPGETATQRTVLYTASTCITDRFSGKDMADVPFRIEYLDAEGNVIPGKSYVKPANEEGCLSWDSTIFHKYYQPEQLIWHKVRIGPAGSKYARELEFATNPWDDKFTFGWDKREFSDEFLDTVGKRKKIPSRFFLSSYGYHTVRFLYNVDRFMELEVKKTVLVELDPVVLRYSGIVNARKQTEPLRDGIYLMKVGIQKDYLDPADRSQAIVNKRESISPAKIPEYGGDVARREYVTAQSQLVRVVDGKINHPVELTMRDLRLMRIRANFMVQLETVDERLVTAHHVLRDQYKTELEKLEARRKELAALPTEERQVNMREKALETKANLESAFYMLKKKLGTDTTSLAEMDLTKDNQVKEKLLSALETNDFTDVKFASGEYFDLNEFLEKDSGLERRSFVGPVIFLSNAFSDAVRATDNLDEARCNEAVNPELIKAGLASPKAELADPNKVRTEMDPQQIALNLGLKDQEDVLFYQSDAKAATDGRQNNAYRFSQYYGSLKHLCNANVDDLLDREKELNIAHEQNMPAFASIYNFVNTYDLDFVTLGPEKLQKLDMSCPAGTPTPQCIHATTERTLPLANVTQMVNDKRESRKGSFTSGDSGEQVRLRRADYTQEDVGNLMFGPVDNQQVRYAYCSLLGQRAAERLDMIKRDERYAGFFTKAVGMIHGSKESMADYIIKRCASYPGFWDGNNQAIFIEDRLRVYETGKYTFLGGLQMNLNVGESTSISRGKSWGYGFEPMDVLGGPTALIGAMVGTAIGGAPLAIAGAAIGSLAGDAAKAIKPISLKWGTGMSNSDGTSISTSTYLVGQIARFNIQLLKHERCRVARLGPEFAIEVGDDLGIKEELRSQLSRGLFVCTGKVNNTPSTIEESYFYFTQHFTEGDMLDQADIYNHPWLLGLRGVREFGTLLDVTNAQEVLNLSNMHKGWWSPEKRELAWPLSHLAKTYRKMLPTFPGLYTVIPDEAKVTNYPLAKRFTTLDTDLNSEVGCTLPTNKNGDVISKVCAQRAESDDKVQNSIQSEKDCVTNEQGMCVH